jgi:hypothetical protein
MSSQSNLTPAEVIHTLSQIGKDIDEATETLGDLDEAVVKARRAYETEYARTFLSTEGAMEVRKYTAKLATDQSGFMLELAEQKHRSQVAHIRALRDRLEVGRSISALVRLEWGNS